MISRPYAIIGPGVVAGLLLIAASFVHSRGSRRPIAPGSSANVTDKSALFEDVYRSSGISFVMNPHQHPFVIRDSVGHGAALIDYDQDGLPDIVLLGPDQVRVYHNDGNLHFSDVTAKMGIRQKGFWQGVAVGDYDNDGYPDLYLCGYDCSALYHNEHGKGFREVTHEAGLDVLPPDKDGALDWRSSAAFVDVDQDGLLDLVVGRYCHFGPTQLQLCGKKNSRVACAPDVYRAEKGSLYMNLGHGHFRDETTKRGLSAMSGKTLGIAAADYNGDGWIDLALANDEVPGNLFQNLGHGFFKEVGANIGVAYDANGRAHGGMGIDWGDYDNSGRFALFVTTYENEPKNLFRNLGNGGFEDQSDVAGLQQTTTQWVGWGGQFVDYDNDGFLDIVEVDGHVMDNAPALGHGSVFDQPLVIFHNREDRTFQDVSRSAGATLHERISGRALCIGDLDNDGREDLLVSNMDGPPLLLHNVCSTAGHWVGLSLVGKQCNRMGLGSEIRVSAGKLKLLRLCSTAGGVLSANDPRVLVGIGPQTEADKISVRWPDGHQDTFRHVKAGRYYVASEGDSALTPFVTPAARPGAGPLHI